MTDLKVIEGGGAHRTPPAKTTHDPVSHITPERTTEPANRLPSRDAIYDLLEPVCELFERHRQAKLEYDRAIAEVARRTGRDLRSVAGALKVLKRRRAEPFDAEDWCNLM